MKKIILKSTGKVVNYGDVITMEKKSSLLGGSFTVYDTKQISVDEFNIPYLIEQGVIELVENTKVVSDTKETQKVPMNIQFYINKLGDKLCIPEFKEVDNLLGTICKASPVSAFSMLLKEIAIELDKQYPDHIQDSPNIYVISTMDGRIHEINKASVKNYRNFSAFRTIEDAKIACRILRPVLKEMFKGGQHK